MILVDTSIWIDHLRSGDDRLVAQLEESQVFMHPFVLGELACGNLQRRDEVLGLLRGLPRAIVATDDEVVFFIERHTLMGRGIGFIDTHLLASASLSNETRLWTRDQRLHQVAQALGLAFQG